MNRSDSTAKLAEALAKAQGAMKAAAMGSVNPHFHSKYASLTEVMEAVREPFAKNGLAIVQSADTPEETGLLVTTILLHTSGEWIESSVHVPVEGGNAQKVGSALTYARRYSLATLCGVVADEDDDGNAASAPRTPRPVAHKPEPLIPPPRAKGTFKGKPFAEVPRADLERAVTKARTEDADKYADFIEEASDYLATLDPTPQERAS